jgi:hypothetical protein
VLIRVAILITVKTFVEIAVAIVEAAKVVELTTLSQNRKAYQQLAT